MGYAGAVVDQADEDERKRFASRRVADELKAAIDEGVYPVGAALPTYRQLAERHHVAVNTAMAAVRMLGDEGYVTNKPNAGSYVRDRTTQEDPELALRSLRASIGELRSQVRQVTGQLAAIDDRLSELSETVTRLEDVPKAP